MGSTVAITYRWNDAQIERAILATVDAEGILVDGLDSADGMAVARTAVALMLGGDRVTPGVLDQLERCRIICRVGTGYDAIDVSAATARGIWVVNVPDYAIDEVSTHAITLLLALARNLRGHLDAARRGHWGSVREPVIYRLAGRTLGILGYGRIGSATARKGLGLGLRVIACDPYVPPAQIEAAGVVPVDFETLLREADFLSLHVPLTAETRRLIDARALALMKPTAFLVNTARGEVVDEDALITALREGKIAGAGLDVLATEPPPPDHPLLHDPRVLVTPHAAWTAEEAGIDVRTKGAEEVARVLRGERPLHPLNEVGDANARR